MKNLKITLSLLVAITAAACYQDKGNYDYRPIPEVRLTTPLRDTTISRGQRLTLHPELKILLVNADTTTPAATFNPDNYTYSWKAYDRIITEMTPVELSVTPVLDTNIYLPVNTNPYKIIFAVTEKTTSVTREFMFNLKIQAGRYQNAWLYLTEEDDGTVDLIVRGTEAATGDIIQENGVLARSGFPHRGKGAKFIYWYTANYITPCIIIGTGEATGYIDKENFEWKEGNLVARTMMAVPQPVDYTFEKIVYYGGLLHWFDSRGSILPMAPTTGIMYPPYTILPPALTGAGYDTLRLAPFLAGATSTTGTNGQLVYDTKNPKMYLYKGSSAAIKTTLDALPPENQLPGHQILHMQYYTSSRTSIAAKKLDDGKYYRYLYAGSVLQPNPEEITNGQLLEQADYFECDNPNGFLYAVINNKLHAYRTNMDGTGAIREVTITNRPGIVFDPVSYLGRFTTITSTSSYIMLATYAGTKGSGKIYYLKPDPTEPLNLTIEEEITGLDRVKSLSRF
ncbi:MAG: hypothetical protein LBI96_01660 [Odoribacteraceae bacterium]|jgi:hypothetical protein|nr:hypothetical protein [Odoribacteraceae bacterium]